MNELYVTMCNFFRLSIVTGISITVVLIIISIVCFAYKAIPYILNELFEHE